MRQLAKAALEAYGLGGASLLSYYEAGNSLYRVYDPNPKSAPAHDGLFEPGQYLLRIYYQTTAYTHSRPAGTLSPRGGL